MKSNAGNSFNMNDDEEILGIDSPQYPGRGPRVSPHIVVCKDEVERWAIVALDWEEQFNIYPCFGFRWFDRQSGQPSSRGCATWMVLPNEISNAFLASMRNKKNPSLSTEKIDTVERFLSGEINGDALRERFNRR